MTTLKVDLYQLNGAVQKHTAMGRIKFPLAGEMSENYTMRHVMDSYRDPWDLFALELSHICREGMRWNLARVALVVNTNHFPPVPLQWYNEPTDLATGIVRWEEHAGDELFPNPVCWILHAKQDF